MVRTVRRDWLRRKVEQGKATLVDAYSFDDMLGESRLAQELSVELAPVDWHDRKPGIAYVRPDEFKTSVGRAWLEEGGLVVLYVHSNSNYTFRVAD